MRLQILASLGLATILPVGVILVQQDFVSTANARVINQDNSDVEQLGEFDEEQDAHEIEFEEGDDAIEDDAVGDANDEDVDVDGEEPESEAEDSDSDEVEAWLQRLSEGNGDARLIQMLQGYLRARDNAQSERLMYRYAAGVTGMADVAAAQAGIAPAGEASIFLPDVAPGQALFQRQHALSPGIASTTDPNAIESPLAAVYGVRVDEDDLKALDLARQYRVSANEKEKEELRDMLRELTEATFQKRLEARVKQIEEAQAKLDKVKAEVEQRKQSADKIVDRRVADLLDEPDPYSWEFDEKNARLSNEKVTLPHLHLRGLAPALPLPPARPGR